MKKKQFDIQTAKKIINEYAEQINLLSRENKVLKKQLEDSKISLQINKDILYSHIKSKKNNSEEIQSVILDLKKENERLNEKIAWLFTEKGELAKKLYKLQDSLNDKLQQENNYIEKERTDQFLFENKLKEKDSQIEILKKQIENLKKNSKNFNTGVNEIYIGDPNKFNTEINNELTMSRAIIKKYVYMMQEERENSKKLKNKIEILEDKVTSISNNTSFINNNNNKTLNNPQIDLINDIFNGNDLIKPENNISVSSGFSEEDTDNIDLSFIKNQSLKENKRTKTCDKIKKVPKLDLKDVEKNYNKNPINIKVIDPDKEEMKNDEINLDNEGYKLLNQKYKSQIQIYKKTIDKYKEKINKLRKQIRTLIDKNSLLANTLKIYMNNKGGSNKKQDVSMNNNVNDYSGLSTNSIIFKGGTLENINKLSEMNKITRLNQIANSGSDNNDIKKDDPLNNIIIKDAHYKNSSKENDTNESSKN